MSLRSLLGYWNSELRPAGQQLPMPLQAGLHGPSLRTENQLLRELALQQWRRVHQWRTGTQLRLPSWILREELRFQFGMRFDAVSERWNVPALPARIPMHLPAGHQRCPLRAGLLRRMPIESLQKQRSLSGMFLFCFFLFYNF